MTRKIFTLFLLFLAGMLLGAIVQSILALCIPMDILMNYITLIIYPIQFIPVILYCRAENARTISFDDNETVLPMDQNRFQPIGGAAMAVMVAVATIACAVVMEPVNMLLPQEGVFYEMIKQSMEMLTGSPLWVSLLTTAVMAPLFEEWLCRGVVMRGLLGHTRPAVAIVCSAAFFAIIHLNPWQAVPAFALGCLFGLVYWKTGSLKLTMLMHCANNSFSILLSKLVPSETETLYQAIQSPVIYGTIYAFSAALVAIFIYTLLKTDFE